MRGFKLFKKRNVIGNKWINNWEVGDKRKEEWKKREKEFIRRREYGDLFLSDRDDDRKEGEERVYRYSIFDRWFCDGGDYEGDEKYFWMNHYGVKVVERREEFIEVFEMFRKHMNWKGEINSKKVVKEFEKFMKFRERIWRDDWSYKFRDSSG